VSLEAVLVTVAVFHSVARISRCNKVTEAAVKGMSSIGALDVVFNISCSEEGSGA
jgi:hypothetical protein